MNLTSLPGKSPYLGDAGWSSPVARQAHNLKVAGSNPAPATIKTYISPHSSRSSPGSFRNRTLNASFSPVVVSAPSARRLANPACFSRAG